MYFKQNHVTVDALVSFVLCCTIIYCLIMQLLKKVCDTLEQDI